MSTRRKPAARWRFFAAAYISVMVLSAAPALAQTTTPTAPAQDPAAAAPAQDSTTAPTGTSAPTAGMCRSVCAETASW